jgi:hypothetical protein
VLYEVDASANELIIYTDHLSTYGALRRGLSPPITDLWATYQEQPVKRALPLTILNMASLGNPTFDTELADSAFKKLNKLGKVAAVKIGAVMLSTEKTDADTLGLYKDTAMLTLSYAESAACGRERNLNNLYERNQN